ncbi:MAG: pyridoxine 5'-phosphate synthase [Bacteroidetes bacterium]|nr:MAG: pyridoxine 5'-phosphate synthase [Bacteroidota bacterium]
MVNLSINLNKVALLRNSRGRNLPDLQQVALDCVRFGGDGITLHPRPDERHARKSDVYALKKILPVELNVEGFPSRDFLKMIEDVKPAQCTLVPDPPDALTSDAGWNTKKHKHFLLEVIQRLQAQGIRTSIFVETDLDMIEAAREIGTNRIELYTEAYASQYAQGHAEAVEPYARAAAFAHELGLEVNAGHDLNLHNLQHFATAVPHLSEVSIGHALISDALYLGLEETIRRYQACLGKEVQVKKA